MSLVFFKKLPVGARNIPMEKGFNPLLAKAIRTMAFVESSICARRTQQAQRESRASQQAFMHIRHVCTICGCIHAWAKLKLGTAPFCYLNNAPKLFRVAGVVRMTARHGDVSA